MGYEDIIVTRQGRIATIEIARPEVLNALRLKTMLEISDALSDIEEDDRVRVVVLTGSGEKAFAAGADISVMAADMTCLQTVHDGPRGQEVTCRIEDFPKPVIARINGIALGGGTEIALACDIRIASENAILGLPEVKLGIIPGYGGTQRLPRLIGMGKAKELIFTGDHISAQEARDLGIVNRVVPRGELDEAVAILAEKIAANAPVALRMAKAAMNNGAQTDLKTALDLESRCCSLSFGTEDRVEGMAAFLEKRAPDFKGR